MWDQLREQLKQLGIEREIEEELRTGVNLAREQSERNQAKIAAANLRNPRRGVEGLGQTKISMDPFQAALATARYGRGWKKDPTLVRRLLQDHPEFKVPYAKKATVTVLKP
jgi:hypothetical protein